MKVFNITINKSPLTVIDIENIKKDTKESILLNNADNLIYCNLVTGELIQNIDDLYTGYYILINKNSNYKNIKLRDLYKIVKQFKHLYNKVESINFYN